MKRHSIWIATILMALFLGTPNPAWPHGNVKLGENGGRLIDFGNEGLVRAEVYLQNGQFFVTMLDRKQKALPIMEQMLEAASGEKKALAPLKVLKRDGRFVIALPSTTPAWLILKFKENEQAKPLIARFKYDPAVCNGCKKQEWLCSCAH